MNPLDLEFDNLIQEATAPTSPLEETPAAVPTLEPIKSPEPSPIPPIGTDEFFRYIGRPLAGAESRNRYGAIEEKKGIAHGKYQFIPARLQHLGYGHVSLEDFRANPQLQEEVFLKHMRVNYDWLRKHQYIDDNTPPEDVSGWLYSMHLGGYKAPPNIRNGEGHLQVDHNKTSVLNYFRKGREAILKRKGAKDLIAEDSIYTPKGAQQKYEQLPQARPNADLLDIFSTSKQASFASGTVAGNNEVLNEVYDKAKQSIEKVVGSSVDFDKSDSFLTNFMSFGSSVGSVLNPFDMFGEQSGIEDAVRERKFNEALARIKEASPDIKLPYNSYLDVLEEAGKVKLEKDRAAEQASERPGILSSIASFTGAVVGVMSDPRELAKAVIAPGRNIIQRAISNMALEVPTQVTVQAENVRQGAAGGIGAGAANVALVGVGGAALEGLAAGAKAAFRQGGKSFREWKEGNVDVLSKNMDPLDDASRSALYDIEQMSVYDNILDNNPYGMSPAAAERLDAKLAQVTKDLIEKGRVESAVDFPTVKMEVEPSFGAVKADLSIDNQFSDLMKNQIDSFNKFIRETASATPDEALAMESRGMFANSSKVSYNFSQDLITQTEKVAATIKEQVSEADRTFGNLQNLNQSLARYEEFLSKESSARRISLDLEAKKAIAEETLVVASKKSKKTPTTLSRVSGAGEALKKKAAEYKETIKNIKQEVVELDSSIRNLTAQMNSFKKMKGEVPEEIVKDLEVRIDRVSKNKAKSIDESTKIQKELDKAEAQIKKAKEKRSIVRESDLEDAALDELDASIAESLDESEAAIPSPEGAPNKVRVEDADGNLTEVSISDIRKEVAEELGFLKTINDCIKGRVE